MICHMAHKNYFCKQLLEDFAELVNSKKKSYARFAAGENLEDSGVATAINDHNKSEDLTTEQTSEEKSWAKEKW